jgi:multicomponent K+:H+ antiporter subunit G
MSVDVIVEGLVCVLLVVGALFVLLGSIGLARFPDLLTRLHGPSKATTLGLGALLIASIAWFTATDGAPSVHELLITVFVALTAPVSAQFVAQAARAEASRATAASSRSPATDPGTPTA